MSRAQLTSTVEQNTGGAVAPYVAGKNAIINGGMDWFQRSTSVTIPNTTPGYYAPDRFLFYSNGGSTTLSRVAGTAGITYATQVATTSGNTQINIENRLEYQSAQLLMGKTVTFSFYVNVATTSGVAIAVGDYYPSSLDNWASVTFAQKGTVSAGQLSAGNWVRQSITFTADSNTTGLGFYLTITGLGANTLQITGLQVEIGSVPTAFARAGGTLSGELAACQRYYQRFTSTATTGTIIPIGLAYSSTGLIFQQPLLVSMRTTPTVIDYANVRGNDSNAAYTLGAITIDTNNGSPTMAYLASTTTGLTTYRPIYATGNGTVGYIGISAEL